MSRTEDQYQKMTASPIPKLVVSLGIPTTISMLVTNFYNMVDTFFVGKLGTSASGAIGIVFGFMSILQAFGFMLGQGAGSIIARKLGQKEDESASEYASISFFLSLICGALVGALSLLCLNPLLRLLGSTETILPYARTYVTFIILAGPFMVAGFAMNNILRFQGKASLAMIGLVSGAVLNIIGDPIFMFGCHMGIAGAGLSTALSQLVSFSILLSIFLRGHSQAKISIHKFSFNGEKIWNILSTGFPSMVRQGLASISTMLLNQAAGVYGDAAVAAMSIVSRINFFIFAVGLGMGQGYQPVCGYNYGAGKYSRVRKAFRFTLCFAECLLGTFALISFFAAPQLVGLFQKDPQVVEIGKKALRYQCMALFLQPLIVMSNMTFQSGGMRMRATFSAMLRNGLYFIPILLISSRVYGLAGVQSAQAVADVCSFATILPLIIYAMKHLPQDQVEEQDKKE